LYGSKDEHLYIYIYIVHQLKKYFVTTEKTCWNSVANNYRRFTAQLYRSKVHVLYQESVKLETRLLNSENQAQIDHRDQKIYKKA
jgi:hypothetical protein